MMPSINMKLGIGFVLVMMVGCASGPANGAGAAGAGGQPVLPSTKAPHAQCLVCKYNADLACVDLEVDPTTPSYTYDGKTYYFCSDTCCKKFQKDPAKYVSQK